MNAPSKKSQFAPMSKAAEPVEAAFAAAKDVFESFFGSAAEGVFGFGREQVGALLKANADVVKNYEDAVAFGKANVEALLDAGNALVAGSQEINKTWLALAQGAVDDGLAAGRRLAACKGTKELIEAQGEIARAAYEKLANEGRRLSTLSVKLAEEVSAPVTARVGATVQAFAKPIAA